MQSTYPYPLSPLRKLLLLGVLVVSALTILVLRHTFGLTAGMIIVLPAIAAAWYFGIGGGIVFAAGNFMLDLLLSFFFWPGYYQSADAVLELVIEMIVLTVILVFVGRIRESQSRSRATILERSRQSREQRAYLDFMATLNTIVHDSLEAPNMLSMSGMLAQQVGELFDADDCFITRWDETCQVPVPTAAYGALRDTYADVPVLSGEPNLTASVLSHGRPLAVENTHRTPYIGPNVARLFPRMAALGLPLIAGERRLGALILGYRNGHVFTEDEITRGELAARQISLAILKVRLLEEAHQRVRELAGLHRISQTFTLQGDAHKTYGRLTEIMAGLMDAPLCVIGLRQETGDIIQAQTPGVGVSDEILQAIHYPCEMGRAAWDFKNGILRANCREQIPPAFSDLANSLGVETVLVAPLWDVEQRMIGVIYMANKEGGFTEDDAHMMETLAGQAAVVIQNTRLLASERRRSRELAVLHSIAVAATESGDEDELLERATNLIGGGLHLDYLATFLLDDHKQELSRHSSYRVDARETLDRIPIELGVTGSVARSGKLRYIPDVSLAPDYISLDRLMQSELCVPLKVEEKVIGVLNAERHERNGFTYEDQELLGILAAQLSTAIQRLRVARAEQQQADWLERSNAMIQALVQVGARTAVRSDIEGIFQTLGKELSRLGLVCMVALEEKEPARVVIRYTSLSLRALRMVEKMTRKKVLQYAIPNDLLNPLHAQEEKSVFVGDPVNMAGHILPALSRRIVIKVLQLLGINPSVVVCHLPLVSEGERIGILWLWGEGLRDGDLPALSVFARQVAAAIQNANLLAEVSRLAITDDLTGIFNRRHFFDLAAREFSQSQRRRQPLAALIMDVDYFKKYNDQYGHQVGDDVLREVALRLRSSLRTSDILGRYGGEEFSVLLPQTDIEAAMEIAERLHASVANEPVQTQVGPLYVQMSIGVAALQPDTISLHALINRADQAMYVAKDAGRNRVAMK